MYGNIRVLDKLRSGISCSTVGPECNVNESTTILNKVSLKRNTHKTNLCYLSVVENAGAGGPQNLTLHLLWEQWLSGHELSLH